MLTRIHVLRGARAAGLRAASTMMQVPIPEQNYAEFLLQHMAAVKDQSKTAVVDAATGRSISYGAFPARVAAAQAGFKKLGVTKGTVVNLHLPNLPEYLVAFDSLAASGAIATTSNPLYTPQELAHQLKNSGASFSVTIPALLPAVKEAAKLVGLPESAILVLGEPNTAFLFDEKSRGDVQIETVDAAKDILVLPYSSGTTGLPKGVMLTHKNLIANLQQCVAHPTLHIGMDESSVVMGVLPCYHIYGMSVVMGSALRAGGTVVTLPKFDPALFLSAIVKYRTTFMPIVPPIIGFLAKHPAVANVDLSCVKTVFSGAAPLDAELQKAAEARMPGAVVRQGYGMTETSPVTHICSPDVSVPGSIGQVVANTEARVVDVTTGADLPAGKDNVGELLIRGPQVMAGYLNNPTATASTLVDGWCHTGDLVYRDEQGFFFVVDRLKELIKCKGLQVAPAELEGILLFHPAIMDAAVVGKPDEKTGEKPVAFVVTKKAALAASNPAAAAAAPDVTDKQVADFVASKVAEYKRLDAVVFVDAIPKNASGKILRRVLKEKLLAGSA